SSPTLFSAVAAFLIARIRRVPLVLEVRDLWPEAIVGLGLMRPGSLGVRLLSALSAFLYRRAARIVVVTRAFADRIAAQGVDVSRLDVIPNGADLSLFAPDVDGASAKATRAALGVGDQFVVAYVGTHGLSHGLGALLDAAALQTDITYLLVGD